MYSQLFLYTVEHILNCSQILLNILFPNDLYTAEHISKWSIYCWTYFQMIYILLNSENIPNCYILLNIFPTVLIYCLTNFQMIYILLNIFPNDLYTAEQWTHSQLLYTAKQIPNSSYKLFLYTAEHISKCPKYCWTVNIFQTVIYC